MRSSCYDFVIDSVHVVSFRRRRRLQIKGLLLFQILIVVGSLLMANSFSLLDNSATAAIVSRRDYMIQQSLLITTSTTIVPQRRQQQQDTMTTTSSTTTENQTAEQTQTSEEGKPFISAAFPKKEYTNSIVASRDTNVSPLEVYETLSSKLLASKGSSQSQPPPRALDVGAGAGVSTQIFYSELGYKNIDAVDWSSDAWEENVVQNGYSPPTVNFYPLDDERFVTEIWQRQKLPKYDIIAFNFAVNRDKALYFCRNLLKDDGLLLAPINTQSDYWLKQTYVLLDSHGNIQWSANDVGAWSVQFQPDVTADTCQGIWCSPFNGFQKLQKPTTATTSSASSTTTSKSTNK